MLAPVLSILLSATSPAVSFPGAQPQLATAGQRVGLVFGREDAVYFAASQDAGRTFTPPVPLPRSSGLHLGKRRGPRIALVGDTFIVTAIAGKRGAGDLFAWRSSDEGRTWAGPTRLNRVDDSAREGLHGMAAGGGVVAVAWLDLRAPDTRVFAAVSRDHGATWSPDFAAYEAPPGGVCECCHPSVAVSPQGEVAVMFRNHVAGARDLYLVRGVAGRAKPGPAEKLGQGTWPLDACPMDGGGLVFDPAGTPVGAWRRDKEIFLTRPGAPEERLGEGRDPAIAVGSGGSTHVVFRQGEAIVVASSTGESTRVLAEKGQSPVLVSLGDGSFLAAWEQDKEIRVTALVL